MWSIFPLDKWFARTAIIPDARGRDLDAVDQALDAYHHFPSDATVRRLHEALEQWIREVGPDWRIHERNQNGAISKLHDEVRARLSRHAPIDELAHWKNERRKVVHALFESARLELKQDYTQVFQGPLTTEPRTAPTAKDVTEGTALTQQLVERIVRTQVDVNAAPEILQYLKTSGLLPIWVGSAGMALAPFKSAIGNPTKLSHLLSAASQVYARSFPDPNQAGLDLTTPHAMVQSVIRIIARDKARRFANAPREAVDAAARAVCHAFDVSISSPATTRAGQVVAHLVQRLQYIGRDFVERRNTNHLLSIVDDIDATTFRSHPILGCYLLTRAETPSIVAFFQEHGRIEWMDDTDQKVRAHLRPVQQQAMKFIEESRFQILNGGVPIYRQEEWEHIRGDWSALSSQEFHRRFGGGVPTDYRSRLPVRDPDDR